MFIRVQRWSRWVFAIAALCAVSLTCSGADTAIIVHPLTGAGEDAVYCEAVVEAIGAAQVSIDILISSVSLDDNPILPALALAADRGIAVRAVLDSSDWAPEITVRNSSTLSYFHDHGIEAKFDDPSVTLHAKLIIIDETIVVLGSSNWNRYAFTEHRQADVLIEDASIGAFYTDYFDVLWTDGVSDQGVEIAIPDGFGHAPLVLPLADFPDSASYAHVLLKLLASAERSIHLSMYRMSTYAGYGDSLANDLLDSLTDAANRGLDVKVLLDDCAYYADSAEANLMAAMVLRQRGVEVRFDTFADAETVSGTVN